MNFIVSVIRIQVNHIYCFLVLDRWTCTLITVYFGVCISYNLKELSLKLIHFLFHLLFAYHFIVLHYCSLGHCSPYMDVINIRKDLVVKGLVIWRWMRRMELTWLLR